jgi:hypothetical protein
MKNEEPHPFVMITEAWKGDETALKIRTSESSMHQFMGDIDSDCDGRLDFDEFVSYFDTIEELQRVQKLRSKSLMSTMM